MKAKLSEKELVFRIRLLTVFFIVALLVSGITAFPIEWGLEKIIFPILNLDIHAIGDSYNLLGSWLFRVYEGVHVVNELYPFMAYGTDWLAFAHIVIALVFVGVYYKPIRNVWIVYWAMIACVLVIPTAFICGYIREIPFFWILVDCSFGVFGIIPLWILKRYITDLASVSGITTATKY